MTFLTPARLATLVGVLTGLSAAATSLLNVFPKDTAVGRTIVAAVGVVATVISVAKFLEGQSAWETQAAQHQHELVVKAVDHYEAKPVVVDSHRVVIVPRAPEPKVPIDITPPPQVAMLPDEAPLKGTDNGVADLAITPDGEPVRHADQLSTA